MSSVSDYDWFDELRAAESPFPLGSIGTYEIEAEIARGGQGVVYRARQPGTGRQVALKRMLAGSLATPSMRRRLEREVLANSMLSHPNIVTLYGIDVVEGMPVLAMQWIDGCAITQWARGAPRPSRAQVLTTMGKVCDAVHYAHQRGILHRDLKPSNVLVDAGGEPHVLDFGLAKLVDDVQGEDATLSGHFLGTPTYAAPEQLRGETHQVDVRSDVWALGAVLYEMLVGRAPLGSDNGLPGMLQALATARIVPPSAIDPATPRDLDLVVLKALAIDPAQRYGSVEALSQDLRRFASGEPVQAHPPSTLYLVRKAVRRHRVLFTVGAVAACMVSALAVVASWLAVRATRAQREAEARGTALAREVHTQQGVMRYLHENLVMGLEPQDGGFITSDLLYQPAEDHLPAQVARQPATEAPIRTLLASFHIKLNQYERAREHLQRALAAAEACDGPGSLRAAECHLQLAVLCKMQWQGAEAEAEARQALALLDGNDAEEAIPLAGALSVLGNALVMQGRNDEAVAPLQQAVAVLRVHDSDDHPYLCDTLQCLAYALTLSDHGEEGEQLAREALATLVPLTPLPDWRQETALATLCKILWQVGKRDECLQRTQQQIESLVASGRVPPHMIAEVQIQHCARLSQCGRHAEALAIARALLPEAEGDPERFRPNDEQTALLCNARGKAARALGALEEARASFAAARDALVKMGTTPDDQRLVAVTHHLDDVERALAEAAAKGSSR